MNQWFISVLGRYRKICLNRRFVVSVLVATALFMASVASNLYAAVYASKNASSAVADLILSNIPVFDVGWFFVYSAFVLVVFVVGLCVIRPQRILFVLYTLSIFYFIRAIFVSLTHLAPFPTQISFDAGVIVSRVFGGADLFFSGYTGVTFLLALMFWQDKVLRYIFLCWSVLSGAFSLLGHLHYSIDIFAAFFITYGIYHIALHFFPKEREFFTSY